MYHQLYIKMELKDTLRKEKEQEQEQSKLINTDNKLKNLQTNNLEIFFIFFL